MEEDSREKEPRKESVLFKERRVDYLLSRYVPVGFLGFVFTTILLVTILLALDYFLGIPFFSYPRDEFPLGRRIREFLVYLLFISIVEVGLWLAIGFFNRRRRVCVGPNLLTLPYRTKGSKRKGKKSIETVTPEGVERATLTEWTPINHVFSGTWGFWVLKLQLRDGNECVAYRNEAKGCKDPRFLNALKQFLSEAENAGADVRMKQTERD